MAKPPPPERHTIRQGAPMPRTGPSLILPSDGRVRTWWPLQKIAEKYAPDRLAIVPFLRAGLVHGKGTVIAAPRVSIWQKAAPPLSQQRGILAPHIWAEARADALNWHAGTASACISDGRATHRMQIIGLELDLTEVKAALGISERGPQTGPGWKKRDDPLLLKMHELVEQGIERSPAADRVAEQYPGHSVTATSRRIRDAYPFWRANYFPDDPMH